jgi:RNA polymerase sigma-70 factor, ECF subfamily
MTTSSHIIADEFERYRPLLFSIAYRMLGNASEVEDMLQEAYLRYRTTDASEIHALKTYLCTIVTRLCLDYLKSARVKREQYIGPWLPEPILTTEHDIAPFESAAQHESISLAFLVLLEALTPPERAVFLLHEVFDFEYAEIAEIIRESPVNCRQLCHRAKKSVAERRHRFEPSRETQLHLVNRFLLACQEGDVQGLKDVLAQDVTNWGDGGGKAVAARRPIIGVYAVIRFWLGLAHKPPAHLLLTFEDVNGGPAVLIWTGDSLYAVITFEVVDSQIRAIRGVLNPDKLVYIRRQLEARQRTVSQRKTSSTG